jgi:hypothetical protein
VASHPAVFIALTAPARALRPRWRRYQDPQSRRTLALPARYVTALAAHYQRRGEPAGDQFMFATSTGTASTDTTSCGLSPGHPESRPRPHAWTPRELRHSLVSLLSSNGVSIEDIADLCAHSGTTITESVYRQQLRLVLLSGAVSPKWTPPPVAPGTGCRRRCGGPPTGDPWSGPAGHDAVGDGEAGEAPQREYRERQRRDPGRRDVDGFPYHLGHVREREPVVGAGEPPR